MRVLVTRALEEAQLTAVALARLGHEALIAPLFEIRFADGPELLRGEIQAILATSGYGVRALAQRSERRDVPLFAVGSHTAAIARSAGFAEVIDAKGDAAALANEVGRRLRPTDEPLFIVTGRHTPPDLQRAVEGAGFRVRVCATYEAVAVCRLPPTAREALASDSLDAVLLFSPRSARVLANRVYRAGLTRACLRLVACCISDPVARELHDVAFGSVRIAVQPDQDHLLALLRPDLPWDRREA